MDTKAHTNANVNATSIPVSLYGHHILENALFNKGTAFTEAERDAFDLHGLLPPHVGSLEEQVSRRMEALRAKENDLERYVFLRDLQDTNETLFYALLTRHLEELLPVIYTPTVGAGCQQFSHLYRKPRGLFLSLPHKDLIPRILAHPRFDAVEAIVVTDGERILGLGDQGAGGMGIPIGKLAIYSGCGGLNPASTLPIVLDVGTNNPERLTDPLYIGWRHERVRGAAYDEFIEAFVQAVKQRWPHVLLQWEDFAKANANRLLDRYRDELCTFNDDIQGTASVATGTLLAAIHVTGVPLRDQKVAILGGGSAGCGIANLIMRAMIEAGLSEVEARQRFYVVGRHGLVTRETPNLEDFQLAFAQAPDRAAGWKLEQPGKVGLMDVVRNLRPTVLIGVSGQAGSFSEAVVREMGKHVERPIIFPLSNPTACSEATPADLLAWTEGRAIVGTGSPFAPVEINGRRIRIDQTNNSYIFPGVGLAAIAVKARRVTDGMFLAAAKALAKLSPACRQADASLLPPINSMRDVSYSIALAVALQARTEGLTEDIGIDKIEALIRGKIWTPRYLNYHRV
jgi:malate dehydrogenase (oxaloacetate-decarboxylating)